ncbi:HutD/Ves family protein [Variovorax ureilyticus]|uniref:HutD/Ves family protein n=1 Tax=Variovorax ureilyticus TaxID=1836198 RepID=UPI003D672D6D
MAFHRFDIASLAATPWKNGGGVTREIACSPPGASMERFDWRVSIATIDRPGPFSAFDGVDRVIMLLDGAGVRLHSQAGGIDHRLDVPDAPFAFDGGVPLDCELLGGTSTDFNVMSRRGRLRADVRVLRDRADTAPVAHGLLLALRGSWHLNDLDCAAGTGVWWNDEPAAWQVAPRESGAALVAVRFTASGS